MATTAKKKQPAKPQPTAKPKAIAFNIYAGDAQKIHDALMCCISREETRYYLNGVCLENGPEGLLAVATDGHRLGRLALKPMEKSEDAKCKIVWQDNPVRETFSVIAPTHFIKRLGSLTKGLLLRDVCTVTIDNGWIHYKDSNEGFSAKLIDGSFPDWRKVVPKETVEQEPNIAFNSRYVSQMTAAIQKVHGRGSPVAFKIKDNASPTILNSRTDQVNLTYVLMPMRF